MILDESRADDAPRVAAADRRVRHRHLAIDGVRLFYREAGDPAAPTVLLLHGFPSSSHMHRHLIPELARRWHVVAPDYPGFGHSDFPPATQFEYSFANYARLIERFTEALGLRRYAIYLQDYGAPVGLRVALAAPQRVSALIVQNGNAYEEGLSDAWDPLKAYWASPTAANRATLRAWLDADGVRLQYAAGLSEAQLELLSPDTWALDWALLARPGNIEVQLDLFGDYQGNVALYPAFQRLLRERQWPLLVVWGRRDPFFTVAGAQAYLRDVPSAEIHLLDAGHFALETHGDEIAALIDDFLARRVLVPR